MLLTTDTSILDTLNSLFNIDIITTVTIGTALLAIGVSLVLGFLISLLYIYTQKRSGGSYKLAVTLIMIPSIVTLILIVGVGLAGALALTGVFSLVRYRSDPASPKDIAYIFFSLAIGLVCGTGYVMYGIIFTLLFGAVLFLISLAGYGEPKRSEMQLKVLIPENLNFEGVIDDILNEDTDSWKLRKVRTSDFGTVFELIYIVKIKKVTDKKKMMDKIRARNGNLNVVLTLVPEEER